MDAFNVAARPHAFVAYAGLIAKRISADLVGNLGAVRDHAEALSIGAVPISSAAISR